MSELTIPENFDIATAGQDFAGEGRTVKVAPRNRAWPDYHIWIKVNGWTISCTWSRWTYCTGAREDGPSDSAKPVSPDAEVAAWRDDDERGGMLDLGGDTVAGYRSPADVVDAIAAAEADDEAGIREAFTRELSDA